MPTDLRGGGSGPRKVKWKRMPSSKLLHRLATHPHEYARWQLTGRLPSGVKPDSPLIRLLRALPARDLLRIKGVVVDSRLGYTGSRRFANAAQAIQWLAPSDEVFGSFPAESWRDKRFARQLTLEELAASCSEFPEQLYERFPGLCGAPKAARRPGCTDAQP